MSDIVERLRESAENKRVMILAIGTDRGVIPAEDILNLFTSEIEMQKEAADEIEYLSALVDEVMRLNVEIERLRARQNGPGTTHWEECWRTRGHHDCAVAQIERLRAENDVLRAEVTRLKEREAYMARCISTMLNTPSQSVASDARLLQA